MNLITKVGSAVLLAAVVEVAAVACTAPAPGIIETPPCAEAQLVMDNPTDLGQLGTPPESKPVNLFSTVEESLVAFLLF